MPSSRWIWFLLRLITIPNALIPGQPRIIGAGAASVTRNGVSIRVSPICGRTQELMSWPGEPENSGRTARASLKESVPMDAEDEGVDGVFGGARVEDVGA